MANTVRVTENSGVIGTQKWIPGSIDKMDERNVEIFYKFSCKEKYRDGGDYR